MVHLELDTAGAPPRRATASFVVAADGVRSGARRRLGIAWHRRYGSGSYAMVDIAHAWDDSRVRLHCETAGLVESFPLPNGRRRWVAADARGALGNPAAFVDAIRERTGRRLELPAGLSPTVFRARQHRAARMSAGRVALLGDAAHEVSPIGGQGMNLGWAAAVELAAALERSLTDARPEFEVYERRLQHAAARAQRRSAFYMTVGHAAKGPALIVRNGAIRLLGTAPLRTSTANMITMQGAAAPFDVRRR